MAREIEAKIKVDNFERLRARLDHLGAANEGDCLERNWVLDDAEGNLRKSDTLLRVRNNGGVDGILTVKRRISGGEFKTREEVESMVDSTDDLLQQLEMIGYKATWIYEKIRQTWLWRDCVVTLDELPELGCYVEIEGTPEKIRGVASELGLDADQHIDDNYLGLWIKHLESRGEDHRNMIFPADAAHRKRATTTIVQRKDANND